MEIIWLVLLIIVPLFAGAIFMLCRQTQSAGPGPQAADRRTDSRAVEDRRRLPRGFGPMGLLAGDLAGGCNAHNCNIDNHAIMFADFDGDGVDDLVTADQGDNTISVLLADGQGGFAPADVYAVGTAPVALAVDSFTPAGNRDLVVGNQGTANYHVLVSDGSGDFTTLGPFGTGNPPMPLAGITAASFNSVQDPFADVFWVGGPYYRGSPGNNDGTINDSIVVGGNPGGNLVAVISGMFDAGNTADLVVVDAANDLVRFLPGNGQAGFGSVEIAVGANPSAVAAGNLYTNGNTDLAVVNRNADTVYLIPGDGFGAWGTPTSFAVGTAPSGVALGDLDGDTVVDIVVCNAVSGDVSVLLSNP